MDQENRRSAMVWLVVATSAMVAALGAGCAGLHVKYQPAANLAGAAKAPLPIEVVDGRPADRLEKKAEVGQVRGSFGIPHGLEDKDPNVVSRTVGEATGDALMLAGLKSTGGSNKRLVARVTEFWLDGFVGYKAGVAVMYVLESGSDQAPIWRQEIVGTAGGSSVGRNPNAMTEELFAAALSDLAKKASAEFKSPAFVTAVAAGP